MTVQTMLGSRKGDVKTVSVSNTLRDAIELMGSEKIGAAIILDEQGGLAGILTERDVVSQLSTAGPAALDKSVASIMTPSPTTCSITEDAYDAIEKMMSLRCRHLPVVEGGDVVGVISARDVMENVWVQASERDRRHLIAQIALA